MIPSPCINLCKMDNALGLCIGCFRSLDEIAAWSRSDDDSRTRILASAAQRRLENPINNDETHNIQHK